MGRRRVAGVFLGMLALGAAEGVSRLLPDASPPVRGIRLEAHPTRIWALGAPPVEPGMPPSYRLTAEGNRAPAAPGSPGAPLILTTGDSSIFGDGLRDGLTLHDDLQVALGGAARVETLAVPGYSTLQTRAALAETGWAMKPRVLVVGNLWSDSNLDAFRDAELLAAAGGVVGRVERGLVKSALFRQLRRGVNGALGRPSARKISWPTPGKTGVRRVPLADYATNLAAIFDGSAERGVGVVVLSLANAPMLKEGLTPEQEWAPYVEVQAAVAAAHGVPRVDALAVYRQSGMSARALFQDELHPTAAATQRLGEAVAASLREAGWPDRVPLPAPAPPVPVPPDRFDGTGVVGGRSVQMDVLDG